MAGAPRTCRRQPLAAPGALRMIVIRPSATKLRYLVPRPDAHFAALIGRKGDLSFAR